MCQPCREEPRLVEAELLQLLGVLGESGREEQLLQRHVGLAGAAAGRRAIKDGASGVGQGQQGEELYLPGSSHSLGLPALQQTQRVLRAATREGSCHHPWQPGLVHAVHHPVCFINDLRGQFSVLLKRVGL